MATILNFEEQGGTWNTKFTSEGACVVELERKAQGTVSVGVNIEGLRSIPVPVANLANPYDAGVIFAIDIPKGLEITIRSSSEVIQGKMQL